MFQLSSSALKDKGKMPVTYVMSGAGGANVSPPLTWTGAPEGTKAFLVAMIDRHPIARDWVHWVVAGIPADVDGLPEGASGKAMPSSARELSNTFGFAGYGGPQPPPGSGDHPYEVTVWALDTDTVTLPEAPSAADLERAVSGRVLAKATLTGFFGR